MYVQKLMAFWHMWESAVYSAFELHKMRRDAPAPLLSATFNQLFQNSQLGDFIEGLGNRVIGKAQRYMKTIVKVPIAIPGRDRLLSEFRATNIALIQGLGREQIEALDRLLANASSSGVRHEELAPKVQEVLDVGQSRAELIARDQILKINSNAQQIAQTQAGIEQYQWSTSGDERVRESHQELDGEIFSWDDPPTPSDSDEPVNPGEAINCRCVAIPIIPLLDDI